MYYCPPSTTPFRKKTASMGNLLQLACNFDQSVIEYLLPIITNCFVLVCKSKATYVTVLAPTLVIRSDIFYALLAKAFSCGSTLLTCNLTSCSHFSLLHCHKYAHQLRQYFKFKPLPRWEFAVFLQPWSDVCSNLEYILQLPDGSIKKSSLFARTLLPGYQRDDMAHILLGSEHVQIGFKIYQTKILRKFSWESPVKTKKKAPKWRSNLPNISATAMTCFNTRYPLERRALSVIILLLGMALLSSQRDNTS